MNINIINNNQIIQDSRGPLQSSNNLVSNLEETSNRKEIAIEKSNENYIENYLHDKSISLYNEDDNKESRNKTDSENLNKRNNLHFNTDRKLKDITELPSMMDQTLINNTNIYLGQNNDVNTKTGVIIEYPLEVSNMSLSMEKDKSSETDNF